MESFAPRGSSSPPSAGQHPVNNTILLALKLAHAQGQSYVGIFVVGVNYSFALGSARPMDGLLTFFESLLRQLAQPYDDALVLTLKVKRDLMKRMLVDSGSATDLLYLPALVRLGLTARKLSRLG